MRIKRSRRTPLAEPRPGSVTGKVERARERPAGTDGITRGVAQPPRRCASRSAAVRYYVNVLQRIHGSYQELTTGQTFLSRFGRSDARFRR